MPIVGLANGVFYFVIFILTVKCLTSSEHADVYGRLIFSSIGCAYACFFVLLFQYHRSLTKTLESSLFLVPPELLKLLNRMCLLLGAVFVVQAVRYFSWTSPAFEAFFMTSRLSCHGICTADFLLNLFLEFFPCLVGFLLLRPTTESPARSRPPSQNSAQNLPSSSETRYSSIT